MAKLCLGGVMSWYAFFVKSGEEDILCRYFDYILRDHEEITYRLIVPKRELIEYKSGSKKLVYKPLFPGYIIIYTEFIYKIYDIMKVLWHSEIYSLIRTDEWFHEIKEDEMLPLLKIINKNGIIKTSTIHIKKDRVLVIDGPLVRYTGRIKKIDPRKGRAKISLNFSNYKYEFNIGVKCLDKLSDNEFNHEIVSIPMSRS